VIDYLFQPGEGLVRVIGLIGLIGCVALYLWVVMLGLLGKETGTNSRLDWVPFTMIMASGATASFGALTMNGPLLLGGAGVGAMTFVGMGLWVKHVVRVRQTFELIDRNEPADSEE
jgi:hypothetical protein